MTQQFTIEVSPRTILGKDFVAELPADTVQALGRFVVRQTFVHSGAVRTVAGQTVDEPNSRPVVSPDV